MKHYKNIYIILRVVMTHHAIRYVLCVLIAFNPLLATYMHGMTIPIPVITSIAEKVIPVAMGALSLIGVAGAAKQNSRSHATHNYYTVERQQIQQAQSASQQKPNTQPVPQPAPQSKPTTTPARDTTNTGLDQLFKPPFEKKAPDPLYINHGLQAIFQNASQPTTPPSAASLVSMPVSIHDRSQIVTVPQQVIAPPITRKATVANTHSITHADAQSQTSLPTSRQASVPISVEKAPDRSQVVTVPQQVTAPTLTREETCASTHTIALAIAHARAQAQNQGYAAAYNQCQTYNQNYVQAQTPAYTQAPAQTQVHTDAQVYTKVKEYDRNQPETYLMYWTEAKINAYAQAQAKAAAERKAQARARIQAEIPTRAQLQAQIHAMNPHYDHNLALFHEQMHAFKYASVNTCTPNYSQTYAQTQAITAAPTELDTTAPSASATKTNTQDYQNDEQFDRFLDKNPQTRAHYNYEVDAYIALLINVCDTRAPLANRYRVLLQTNDYRMRGSWGRHLSRLVRKLNRFYFDQNGNLKSLVRDNTSYKEMENLLLHFFAYAAQSQQQFLNCIQFAQARGLLGNCDSQIRAIRDNIRYYNDKTSIVSSYSDSLNGAEQSVVNNNPQNKRYLEFYQYCSIDSNLLLQIIAENISKAERIFTEQKRAYPTSLTTEQMQYILSQAHKEFTKLKDTYQQCSASVALSGQPQKIKEHQLPGAPSLEVPLPHPTNDTPEIKLPVGNCGPQDIPQLPQSICPDTTNPGDTRELRPCNYSQSSHIPELEVIPQVTNQTPQPEPDQDSADTIPEEMPQIRVMPAAEDIGQTQADSDTEKKEKKQKKNRTYEEQAEEVKASLAEKIRALKEQLQKELAATSIVEELLAIEQRIKQAIEAEQARTAHIIVRITNAKAKDDERKAQEALEREQAAQGLTADNLPEIKPEDLHERIDGEAACALIEKYKFILDALNTDGPLTRIVTKGLKNCKSGEVNRAEGAFKELLVADMFEHEIIKAFNKYGKIIKEIHITLGLSEKREKVEFDIETEVSLIEVKAGKWKEFTYLETLDDYSLDFLSKLTWKEFENIKANLSNTQINLESIESIYEILKNFLVQKEMAKIMNKEFILVYFNELPISLKKWLENEAIKFTEYKKR